MATIKTYKDLRVYQISMELLDRLYDIAYKIPHLKLRTQLINSGEAIPPLIAEGFAKKINPKEAARYYEMAMAESDEVCVHFSKAIILSKRFKQIPVDECKSLEKEYHSLAKQLNRLSVTWRNFSAKKPTTRLP
ncbi:MAG: four helix bundle protein [Bacteroidota bacterium]